MNVFYEECWTLTHFMALMNHPVQYKIWNRIKVNKSDFIQQLSNQDTEAAFGKGYSEGLHWKYSQVYRKLCYLFFKSSLWSTGGSTLLAMCTKTTCAILYHLSHALYLFESLYSFKVLKHNCPWLRKVNPTNYMKQQFDCLV
jgi:hypothetical protein